MKPLSVTAEPAAEPLRAAAWHARRLIQADRDVYVASHIDPKTGKVPAAEQPLLDEYDSVLRELGAALAKPTAPINVAAKLVSADGSLTLGDAIDGVVALYPGADKQALRTLGSLLTKPTAEGAPALRDALQAYFDLTEPLLGKFVFTAERAGEVAAIVNAARAALASVHPPSVVRAKPLEWRPQGDTDWSDERCGFYISFDPEDQPETPYTAAWGEGDTESFATLTEAKAWCQREIDAWIAENAHPVAPSEEQR